MRIYNPEKLIIRGDNVRIDDFTYISCPGELILWGNNHITAGCRITGKARIEMKRYSNLSANCSLVSSSDDFGGNYFIGPMAPEGTTRVIMGEIVLESHVVLGIGCTVLPGAKMREGSAFGALSLILGKDYSPWCIYAGQPAAMIKTRKKGLLDFKEYQTP